MPTTAASPFTAEDKAEVLAELRAQMRVERLARRPTRNKRQRGVPGGAPGMSFLDETNPVWESCREAWERNERRMRGGDPVHDELRRFDWESEDPPEGQDKTHYEVRRDRAVYVNLPDDFATATVGHLMREAPQPGSGLDFGSMGEVRRAQDIDVPTPAELTYYNADGVGSDGSQWDGFWASAMKRAMATGHRWISVEAPREAAGSWADVLSGRRPYIVEDSPLAWTNWWYDEGELQFAVKRLMVRRPRVDSRGVMRGNDPKPGYLLYVRYGCDALGEQYRVGGWWLYDERKQEVGQGRWTRTRGEIPLVPLFWERDTDYEASVMSRPALTELGSIAVSVMDVISAWLFDAWDAAKSIKWLRGVDLAGYTLAADKIMDGSQLVPLEAVGRPGATGGTVIPDVTDGSGGAVASGVFEKLLEALLELATLVSRQVATSTPDASGVSKQVGFQEQKEPRLALAASNMEGCQNAVIRWLEMRWGTGTPSGSTVWPRKFELQDLLEEIQKMFTLQNLAGTFSPTLTKKLMVTAARERGFVTDDKEAEDIESEYADAANRKVEDAKAASEKAKQEPPKPGPKLER